MIFSFKKLKKMANLMTKTKIEDVVNAINTIGFEVKNVIDFAPVSNIKFGKIMKIYKNPNADRLNVCEIKFKDKIRIIQTSANNINEGMMIVAFVPGSKIGANIFYSKKIKGIESEGMLTNPSEFGINKDLLRNKTNDGIYEYKNVSINDDVIEFLELNDKLIEVDILSNRSDAASYYVMAKEIATYFNIKTLIPKIKIGKLKSLKKVIKSKAKAIVFIEANNDFEISIQEQLLLAKHNIRSINNATDLSNLALIYSGLPIHIYDKSKVGRNISILEDSSIVFAIGNKKIKLNDNLVIKDENKPISIASVIGLENTKNDNNTKFLLIELGVFKSSDVRKTIRNVKMDTNASRQGSKGTSIGMLEFALIYLTNKLKSFSNIINYKKEKQKIIEFDEQNLNQIAGFNISKTQKYKDVIKAMLNLDFEFNDNKVKIPLYRYDISFKEDIYEEIFRFYGYNMFEPKQPNIKVTKITENSMFKKMLQAQGYNEVRTYTLISEKQNKINPFNFKNNIKLKTFVSKEREEIRNSQMCSLIEVANYNLKRNIKNINIFSEGMINNGIKTIAMLSTTKDFYKMQTNIINIIPGITFKRFKNNSIHPNIGASIIFKNKVIGWIGKIHPYYSKDDLMMVEIIKKNYVLNPIFIPYNTSSLKYNDINIELNKYEDIKDYLVKYKNKHKVEIIDKYKVNEKIKITIRVYE